MRKSPNQPTAVCMSPICGSSPNAKETSTVPVAASRIFAAKEWRLPVTTGATRDGAHEGRTGFIETAREQLGRIRAPAAGHDRAGVDALKDVGHRPFSCVVDDHLSDRISHLGPRTTTPTSLPHLLVRAHTRKFRAVGRVPHAPDLLVVISIGMVNLKWWSGEEDGLRPRNKT